MQKILIVVPDLSLPGGVSNYYSQLGLDSIEGVDYFNINGGIFRNTFLRVIERNISFFFQMFKYNIIHLNPSFLKYAFLRESVLILLAKLFKKKVVVFIRGWDTHFESKVHANAFYNQIFKKIWCRVDMYLVLGNIFVDKLKKLGISKTIKKETTLSVYQEATPKTIRNSKRIELLFISRLVKEKGIFIALKTMKVLQKQYGFNNIHLNVAGDGNLFKELEMYIQREGILNCHLHGNVFGAKKDALFKKSHIMLFPTYYGEGLPNVILEAMGSGLPIVSRVNAGIPDHIIHGINGYLTDSKDPQWFAEIIATLINDVKFEEISLNNIRKAEHYSKQSITNRLLNIYEEL